MVFLSDALIVDLMKFGYARRGFGESLVTSPKICEAEGLHETLTKIQLKSTFSRYEARFA